MFEIICMGYRSVHKHGFKLLRTSGSPQYWLHHIKTRTHYFIRGIDYPVEPNSMILIDKRVPFEVNTDDEYIDSYIQFDTSDGIPREIMNHPIPVGDAFRADHYMLLLSDALYLYGRNEVIAEELTHIIIEHLYELVNHPEKQSRYFGDFSKLRTEIYSKPQNKWDIKTMAKMVHLSEPYFQELYKSFFGVSAAADVINGRIKAAKMHLSNNNLSINEISFMCGYSSTVHFSRQFKQHTGKSPSEYRKE